MFLLMDVYIFYQWDSKERNLDVNYILGAASW
jgi:hypothetical protein